MNYNILTVNDLKNSSSFQLFFKKYAVICFLDLRVTCLFMFHSELLTIELKAMSQENYKLLGSILSKSFSINDLAPDSDCYCCLGFDENVVIYFPVQCSAQLGTLDADKAGWLPSYDAC